MKKLFSLVLVGLFLVGLTSADTVTYPSVENSSFKLGEKLRYRVTYGFMDAGEAVLEVKSTSRKGSGRDLYHIVGTGKTLGGFNAFYKARTLDMEGMKKGKQFSFQCFMDDEIYDLKIKYVGEEEIKIRKGKFKCHKFVPVVQTGRYFENEEDVQFWVTADKNKIPVLVKAKIPVGSIKLHLVEWENLKNDLTSKL